MSHISAIYVQYYHAHREFSVPELIDMYLNNGWNLNNLGYISLRPLGDKDDFDWIQLHLDQADELYSIVRNKVEANEDPAVVLMWNNDEAGAVTTFFPKEKRIRFLLTIGRKRHPYLPEWTDINWYLPPIVNPLLANGLLVEQIEFSEMV